MSVKYYLCLLLPSLLFLLGLPQTTAKNYYNPIMDVNVTFHEPTDENGNPLPLWDHRWRLRAYRIPNLVQIQLDTLNRKTHIILNRTLINEGPPLFKQNGVDNVIHYEVTIPCSDKRMPASKPHLKVMHNMTYYYHYYFTCVDNESEVCAVNDVYSGKEKDLDSGKEKDLDSGKEKDLDSGKEKDLDSGKEKDLDSGKEKDLDSGKEKDLDSGKEKDLDSGKEKDLDSDEGTNLDAFLYGREIYIPTTSGIPMLVHYWDKYHLCSFSNDEIVTYYTIHERLHDMNIAEYGYYRSRGEKRKEINNRLKEMLQEWRKKPTPTTQIPEVTEEALISREFVICYVIVVLILYIISFVRHLWLTGFFH